ncbi:CHASE2 domain-containing protein [Thermodesulfobacteriota bacterium]
MKNISLLQKKTEFLIGILVVAVFLTFSFSGFPIFESLERIIYGMEMRLALPRNLAENKIAIVNIDQKSIEKIGPWPWPRHIIADMITILKQNGAKLIGLDIVFSKKEHNQGLLEVKKLYKNILNRNGSSGKDSWVLQELGRIEERLDNDKVLARTAMESGILILPVLGSVGRYDSELVLEEDSFLVKNAIKAPAIKAQIEDYIPVNQLTAPYLELSRNSRGLGHINPLPNALLEGQAHPLFINYRGHIIPSMPIRLALDYLDKPPASVFVDGKSIRLGSSSIPTFRGQILIKFKGARRSFPYYSFVDILNVKKVPAVFENKIALIGYTAEGMNSINTPVDPKMPRVELTANITEGLITGRYLKRPDSMVYVEGIILLLVSLIAAYVLPGMNLVNRLGVAVGLLLLVFLSGVLSFIVLDVWFKSIYITLALITIVVITSIRDVFIRQKSLVSKESIETNRMLGLTFQSQGLLDLAFEKFRKCPLDDAMKDVVYNLGLDYERKRMINKAVAVYEYITQKDHQFRDLNGRIPKLKKMIGSITLSGHDRKKDEKIVVSDDLEIKPTVGRYEILNELGQGAMGVVYQAKDPKINRMLAIKTIRFSDEFEEERVREVKDRFLREAELAGKLSHPSIVSIYDVGEDYDLTYLAMEYLEGENLLKYCKKGSLLPFKKVLYVIGETAAALDYSHLQGVVHRDVKPANIMLLKNGKVKVTDFGIAKAVSSSQTKSGVILGTPNYMSPEQINGQPIDGHSDVFSLGVVFYELLTGQLPFQGKSLTNLFYQIVQVKHPSPREINPKIPKPCEQILDKALAKDPENRFEKAGDFAKYIRAMIQKIDQMRAKANR